jgi:small subunit ribosomal protein S4e
MHIKRNKMSTTWPLPRKTNKKRFIAVPTHASNKCISVLFILRDVLKIAKTRKEAKYMTLNGDVKINNKVRADENFPVQVFDVIGLEQAKKNYRLEIVNKKFQLKEISDKEAAVKIVKIGGKKILDGGKIQMNLTDGQNFVVKDKFSVGDSVVLNTKEDKIEKILPLKEGAEVEIVAGKHAGKKGKLVKFEEIATGRSYLVKLEDKEVSLPFKTLLVIK